MRKLPALFLFASIGLLAGVSIEAYAATQGQTKVQPAQSQTQTQLKNQQQAQANAAQPQTEAQTQHTIESTQVLLYQEPKADPKNIIKKLPPITHLIPIYQKDGWIKVGDPMDGQIGWINAKQYHEARENYYQPNIQTIFIQTTADQKGKPSLNIVAYKNGQQVSQEEATKLYNQMRDEQQRQLKEMNRYYRSMQRMMTRTFSNMQHVFDTYWEDTPWFEPIILLPSSQKQVRENSKKENPTNQENSKK